MDFHYSLIFPMKLFQFQWHKHNYLLSLHVFILNVNLLLTQKSLFSLNLESLWFNYILFFLLWYKFYKFSNKHDLFNRLFFSKTLFVYLSKPLILSGSLQIIWLVFQVFELKSNAFDDQIGNSDWQIFIEKKKYCVLFLL